MAQMDLGWVLVDRQGVVAQADMATPVHIGEGIAIENGILFQPLILYHTNAAKRRRRSAASPSILRSEDSSLPSGTARRIPILSR